MQEQTRIGVVTTKVVMYRDLQPPDFDVIKIDSLVPVHYDKCHRVRYESYIRYDTIITDDRRSILNLMYVLYETMIGMSPPIVSYPTLHM